ncbi:SGNH/GDSL hydrolase family protein [Streptosporangium carneum]|uniref:Lipase n=1 Tax=Streptosporangium carneum TaxID=47481 RepID=A0A9W6I3Z2_9ACTN|nr:SGNH/GDSL hydrolase family protein [Streptosporangium carneum]GLK11642.1 lipase [Streptosporangium carneum]
MRGKITAIALATAIASGGTAAVAAPAQAVRAPLDWVALGDSYTAGVILAAGREYERPRDGCARTTLSYPQVIEAELNDQVDLRNVSCGNATIANVVNDPQEPIGRHLPPFSNDPDYPFAPVPPQLESVSPDTDVVTVGVGGNSLGFGQILFTCIELGLNTGGRGTPCKDHYGDELDDRLSQVSAEYDEMLTAINARARHAKVITVGYPHIIPDDTTKCIPGSLVGFGSITRGDLDWLRTSALEPLNAVIRTRTAEHGDVYVDQYTSSRGHSVCDKAGGNNWVEGILDTSGRFALVHPNARGHANVATLVKQAILDL